MLNSLIGASDLRKSVETIWNRDKNAFSVMDILIAVRTRDKKKILDSVGNCVPLESMFISVDSVMTFLTDTGLGAVLQNQHNYTFFLVNYHLYFRSQPRLFLHI